MPYVLATIETMSLGEAFGISLLGITIGFIVLVSLMFLVYLMRYVIGKVEKPKTETLNSAIEHTSPEIPTQNQNTSKMIPAKGSIGEVNLHTVDDKTAAILMAIVADEIGLPLNELRFTSIREVQPDTPNATFNKDMFEKMFDAAVSKKTDYK